MIRCVGTVTSSKFDIFIIVQKLENSVKQHNGFYSLIVISLPKLIPQFIFILILLKVISNFSEFV